MQSKEEIERAADLFGFAELLLSKSEDQILKVDDAGNILSALNSKGNSAADKIESIKKLLANFEWNNAAKEWLNEELKK